MHVNFLEMRRLHPFPPPIDFNSVEVLTALASANRALGEVKGRAAVIPNQEILIDTLALQEAFSSSEIENIVTSQDELFRADSGPQVSDSPEAKEVLRYRVALKEGYQLLQKHGNITNETLITMYRRIKLADDGFRKKPVYIGNPVTKEVIYTPPAGSAEVQELMNGLERFINDDTMSALDPLLKMALIHYQFESIHPFSDGNGRVGRILNMLYLTKSKLLDNPILYPSRIITQTKERYYRLFVEVHEQEAWHEWVVYMLGIVEQSAHSSLYTISRIRELMAEYKNRIREQFGFYSQDLLNNIFRHPYSRVVHLQHDLGVARLTATRYLDALASAELLEKRRVGRNSYYINLPLVEIFTEIAQHPNPDRLMQIT